MGEGRDGAGMAGAGMDGVAGAGMDGTAPGSPPGKGAGLYWASSGPLNMAAQAIASGNLTMVHPQTVGAIPTHIL